MNLSSFRSLLFTFFLIFVILFSCTKIVTTDIGADLIPPVDGVITKDTVLEVVTKNSGYDTISVGISDDHVLGYVNDAIFGTTDASINFQLAPQYTPLSFGINKDSVVLDSIVLCLKYNGVWGDSSQPVNLHVYNMEPEQIFSSDSSYNNNRTFETAQELTEFNVAKTIFPTTLKNADSTAYYKEPTINQIRIRLNNWFGQTIVDADSTSYFTSDSAFYNLVRGVTVESEKTGQSLLLVNLLDTTTHLSLYYHSKDLKDTLTRRFSPNVSTSASSNTIIRNYQGTQIPSYVASADTNDDLIFMQTSPGTNATLNIQSVKGMQNVIVHRAEMLMYQVPDASDKYLTPPNLFLAAYSKDSMRNFAIPYDVTFYNNAISNLVQFGVLPKYQTVGAAAYYSFDITRYVQSIITRQNTLYNLKLYAPYNQYIYPIDTTPYSIPISSPALNTVAVGRVRLGGGSNNQYRMKLHIVYSLN